MTHEEMTLVLREVYGGAWALSGNSVEGLVWDREDAKPTDADLLAALPVAIAAKARREVDESRRVAYTETADPLFLMWQRGEATEQDWLDAVAAVKAAYPWPES